MQWEQIEYFRLRRTLASAEMAIALTEINDRQPKKIVGTSNVVIASDYSEDSPNERFSPLDLFETSTYLPTSHANNICLPNWLN